MSLHLDIRIGCEKTRFIAYHQAGQIIETGGCYYLPKMIGLGRALEFAYTGQTDAETAFRWGMINHLVDSGKLEEFTRELCGKMLGIPPLVHWYSNGIMRSTLYTTLYHTILFTSYSSLLINNSYSYTSTLTSFLYILKPFFSKRYFSES